MTEVARTPDPKSRLEMTEVARTPEAESRLEMTEVASGAGRGIGRSSHRIGSTTW